VFLQKLRSRVPGWEFDLPTEAQWEYACRAGSPYKFFFGDDKADMYKYGNYADKNSTYDWADKAHNDGFVKYAPVGSYRPNAWGLHDMHGNVSEACANVCMSPYDDRKARSRTPMEGGRAVRGGSHYELADHCRIEHRYGVDPAKVYSNYGFRIVAEARPVPRRP